MTGDRGSAGVLLAAVAAVVLVLTLGLGLAGAYLRGRIEASTAADAAALAAAPVTFLPFGADGTPTEEAARFAAANGAVLVFCSCATDRSWNARTVTVEVARSVGLGPLGAVTVRARSRAEFVPSLLLGGREGPAGAENG
jgi:secretion/DNA translocation related TadE-like protein